MRTIKFRAWNKKEKYMSEEISLEFLWKGGVKGVNMFLWSKDLIVMQFTGLTDKNGKEIYEGDIVQDKRDYNNLESEVVVFEKGKFTGKRLGNLFEYHGDTLVVIGNIWENPELLKEEQS